MKILILVIVILCEEALCLNCFSCETSIKDSVCHMSDGNEPKVVDCDGLKYTGIFPNQEFPIGIYYNINIEDQEENHNCLYLSDGVYMYRNCVRGTLETIKGYCDLLEENEKFSCKVCDGDRCNITSSLHNLKSLWSVTLLLSAFIKLLNHSISFY
ncbi:PREDICTED: uncharacterized protein LOC108565571 [Nicrophorus vespilloides]|uniref:Uncharacterized protein LOC108565571 n=1 Tax=Nicrophorus vespilloides TaxID=110193 RepID=A0ABM1N195_NICVS|nr:PREDICTED: uncharacterized protein LOC108565571 [Nicrophorus vespilloides]